MGNRLSEWRDYNTGLYLVDQVRNLHAANIPLYLNSSNHDAASPMTRTLRMPENVTSFSVGALETALIPELDLAIEGRGFATAAFYEVLSEGCPVESPGYFNFGMLHNCASGHEGLADIRVVKMVDFQIFGGRTPMTDPTFPFQSLGEFIPFGVIQLIFIWLCHLASTPVMHVGTEIW